MRDSGPAHTGPPASGTSPPSVDCFLCAPDPELVYQRDEEHLALCGLGPIVAGYSVVATVGHIPSAADAAAGQAPKLAAFVSSIRERLAQRYGGCLLSEHGRVPACVDVSGSTDPHCFHAHFLLFPGVRTVDAEARRYFAVVESARSLEDALALAARHEEYFLLSPERTLFLVMSRPGRLIRQFVRLLVADSVGRPGLANWRRHPNRQDALTNAETLRRTLKG